jgi:2-polyprenyl-3-methyl-5-hydroxy-6-metoxy-1,4-benzoquinol methylase
MKNDSTHDIIWTKEKVAKFWDYYSTSSSVGDVYFSEQLGDAVLALVGRYIRISGNVLDYGCGPGFLIERLLKLQVSCSGLDAVESNIKIIDRKFKDNPLFKGSFFADSLPTPIKDGQYDLVFLVETIEHLLQEDLRVILDEIYRITLAGGHVVITTRNDENLDKSKRICPDCGGTFHLMQHVSSWSVNSLANLMAEVGFQQVACIATTLRPRTLLGYYKSFTDRLTGHPAENLIYIGKK